MRRVAARMIGNAFCALASFFRIFAARGMLRCILPEEIDLAHEPHSHKHSHHHHGVRLPSRREFLSSVISAAVLAPLAMGQQQPQGPSEIAERFRKMSEDYEREGLAPFKGITTNGEVVPGLFDIRPTGASTEAVRNAAEKFIATLSPVQLARTMYPVDDIEWRA